MGPGPAACSLDQKCQFYLSNGLATSTRRVYRSAQRQFIDFCTSDGHVSSNGSLLPTSEQTLLRFCSHLADRLHHSSIKVYLSAIRSLHIDQGFPDPLVNCLQLQCPLRGIKRHQGSTLTQCQPVTPDHADYPAFLGHPQLGARHAVSSLLPRFLWIPKGWGVYGQPHL